MKHDRIGFIGVGNMGAALLRSVLDAGFRRADALCAFDVSSAALEKLSDTGVQPCRSIAGVASQSDVILLAVKPQQLTEVLTELRRVVTKEHLVISIAAGVSIARLQQALEGRGRIVRVMPNTPCLVGEMVAGFAMGPGTDESDARFVESFLGVAGKAFCLPENLLDVVTGLSGSGPAFVAIFVEALADGGVRMGLPRNVANELAARTVLGSAKLLIERQLAPSQLKDMVASPGGTTIAGVHALERGRLRAAVMDAVEAATRRSQELGSS